MLPDAGEADFSILEYSKWKSRQAATPTLGGGPGRLRSRTVTAEEIDTACIESLAHTTNAACSSRTSASFRRLR
jgi:hypothetical protein